MSLPFKLNHACGGRSLDHLAGRRGLLVPPNEKLERDGEGEEMVRAGRALRAAGK